MPTARRSIPRPNLPSRISRTAAKHQCSSLRGPAIRPSDDPRVPARHLARACHPAARASARTAHPTWRYVSTRCWGRPQSASLAWPLDQVSVRGLQPRFHCPHSRRSRRPAPGAPRPRHRLSWCWCFSARPQRSKAGRSRFKRKRAPPDLRRSRGGGQEASRLARDAPGDTLRTRAARWRLPRPLWRRDGCCRAVSETWTAAVPVPWHWVSVRAAGCAGFGTWVLRSDREALARGAGDDPD
jgi:hypothetical protein